VHVSVLVSRFALFDFRLVRRLRLYLSSPFGCPCTCVLLLPFFWFARVLVVLIQVVVGRLVHVVVCGCWCLCVRLVAGVCVFFYLVVFIVSPVCFRCRLVCVFVRFCFFLSSLLELARASLSFCFSALPLASFPLFVCPLLFCLFCFTDLSSTCVSDFLVPVLHCAFGISKLSICAANRGTRRSRKSASLAAVPAAAAQAVVPAARSRATNPKAHLLHVASPPTSRT